MFCADSTETSSNEEAFQSVLIEFLRYIYESA